jgi:hypothetical protein
MTRIVGLFMAGLLLPAPAADAAQPSVMRVAVVPSAGQMSLVVELSDEVRGVSTQQVTPTLLLVEAGPIALPLKRQRLSAPSGLALLQQVAVDEATTEAKEHVLRLSVTMKRPAASTARVVGRRVYIDFMIPDAPRGVAMADGPEGPPLHPSAEGPPLRPLAQGAPRRSSAAAAPERRQTRGAANLDAAPATMTRQALTGPTSRLDEIQPFLLSATSAPVPNPTVLNAVADAISSVQNSLRAVQPPARQGPSFQLLVSAATLAAEAVSADFHGDRAAKAKQSMAVFAAAKAQLQ